MSDEVFDPETTKLFAAVTEVVTRRTLDAVLLPPIEAPGRQDRLASIGLMSAGIAHDLGNLVQIIDSGLRCVERRFSESTHPEVFALLCEIRGAAARAGALTAQLIDHARGVEQKAQSTDVGALVLQMQPLLTWAAGPLVSVTLDVQPGLSTISCTHSGLESAVINLAVNARHAMPEGGKLAVALRQQGDTLLLVIADTGCGMSVEAARRACEPFVSTRVGRGGSGLGLAVVKAFMAEVSGEMMMESTPGQGTVVVLKFRAAT